MPQIPQNMTGGRVPPPAGRARPARRRRRASRPAAPARTRTCRAVAGLAAAALTAALAACGGSAAGAGRGPVEKPGLTVSVVPASGAAAVYIAQQEGFFAAAGLHVRIVPVTSGAHVISDLVNGSVDVDEGQWTSDLSAEAAGVRLHALAPGNTGGPGLQELMIRQHSAITSPGQLRGKKVAVNVVPGLASLMTDSILAGYGITPAQVHLVAIPFPDMAAALAGGQVSAAFMVEPYITQSYTRHGAGIAPLADLDQGATQNFPNTGYVVTASWLHRYPRTAAAFTRALAQGQHLAATSRPAVEHALARAITGISARTAAVMALGAFPLDITTADLGRVGDLMQQFGVLPRTASVRGLAGEMTR